MKDSGHSDLACFWATVLLVAIGSSHALAQTSGRGVAPRLPGDATRWMNEGPYSNEMLAGKAALFWFFEET